jgi:hypothetical protein
MSRSPDTTESGPTYPPPGEARRAAAGAQADSTLSRARRLVGARLDFHHVHTGTWGVRRLQRGLPGVHGVSRARPQGPGAVAREGAQAQHTAVGQGPPVSQSGAFTSVAIDSFKDRFSMLPDKMASLVAARQELAASEVSTPKLIARVRGKALHYGCAIPFIAAAAPSLSQLMHGRETGAGPVEVLSLDAETKLEFDWDMELRRGHGAKGVPVPRRGRTRPDETIPAITAITAITPVTAVTARSRSG